MMTTKTKLFLTLPLLLVSLSAYAHEGEEHGEEAQELDCSSMETTDHTEAHGDDPVMQAMMQKCHAQMAAATLHAGSAATGEHGHGETAVATGTVAGSAAAHSHDQSHADGAHGDSH